VRIGYCRVSTEKAEQDISIEGQRTQLEEAGCDLVISERASGYKGQRKGWNELWAMVAAGQATEVLTIDQSRLSRSGDDLQFLELCALHGVKVRALAGGPMEVESYTGFLTTGMLSVMNKAFSKQIGVKTIQGIARRKAAGYLACSKVPFGYCVVENKVKPHPEDFVTARHWVEQLLAMECNITAFVRHNRITWSARGIRRWIINPMLRGQVNGKWGECEQLISWGEWERIDTMLSIRTRLRGTSATKTHLFTSLISCNCCGKNLHYVFTRKTRIAKLKCLFAACDRYAKSVREAAPREQVIQALSTLHNDLAALANQRENKINPEAEKIKAEIAQLNPVRHLPGIEALIDQQHKQLRALEKQPTGDGGMGLELLSQLFSDPAVIAGATDDELRSLIIEFISQIIWLGDTEFEIALR